MSQNFNIEALQKLPEAALINYQALQQALQDYVERMSPGKSIGSEEGAQMQLNLWNLIKLMLKREGGEFALHYGEFLRVIRDNRKGAFGERYLYRFFEHLRLSKEDIRLFQQLLNLMIVTCEPGARAVAMRQVDLRTSLAGLRDENQRQKIAAYYAL